MCVPAVVLLLPLLLLITLVLELSGGEVIYRAPRIGRDGRPFTMLKFATMAPGDGGPRITRQGDMRITPVGRWLRASKLNELPQIFNVLKGDMSLVGPRPEDPRYTAHYSTAHRRVLAVRPGLTSRAFLRFGDEQAFIERAGPLDVEEFYLQSGALLDSRQAQSSYNALNYTHVARTVAARGIGLAEGALMYAVEYVKQRAAFGKTIADMQGVQWKIAELATEIEAARLLTYRSAWMADRGQFTKEYVPFLSMAKYYATEVAVKASDLSLQMLGAAGYMKDHLTELYYRDAKQLTIVEGTTQVQLGLIARGVLDRDLWWD